MILIVINRTAVTIVIINNNVAIDNSTRVTGIEFSVNFYKKRYNKVDTKVFQVTRFTALLLRFSLKV